MKKFLKYGVSLLALCALSASASGLLSPSKVVDSTLSSTNIVQNQTWPNSIAASTSVTNVTKFDASGGGPVSLQFTASAVQTNGGAVIIQLARSISGGGATNAAGTGLNLDLFATMTNTLPANTATSPNTVIASWTPVGGQSSTAHGAEPTWYIYSITTPANVTLTNFSVWKSP